MARSSPRANMGFSILLASMAPSAAPAPTTVWSSSINRIIRPLESCTSFNTAFNLSSNSPRYLAPATRAPISKAIKRLPFKPSGTSLLVILRANPSAIAVLPTPGSPIKTGLFLVRRDRISITRRISSSRPMTGSSWPSAAIWVKSRP